MTVAGPTFDLVVAANRLPVERVLDAGGRGTWQRSPGGLVTALESVMTGRNAAWVGWAGVPGPAPEPFHQGVLYLHPVGMTAADIAEYYEGFSNDTLWPIYHDVIVPASFHRNWWNTYRTVNHRFAQAIAQVAAPGATVWVHDYQLQLVPAMVRAIRPDVRIGWFNHIPFPPVELFAQLPWRRALVEGLLGADFLGFQRTADAENFLRICRQLLGMSTKGDTVTLTHKTRPVKIPAPAPLMKQAQRTQVSPGPQVNLRGLAYEVGALGAQPGRSTESLDGARTVDYSRARGSMQSGDAPSSAMSERSNGGRPPASNWEPEGRTLLSMTVSPDSPLAKQLSRRLAGRHGVRALICVPWTREIRLRRIHLLHRRPRLGSSH